MHFLFVGALAPNADIPPEAPGQQVAEHISSPCFALAGRRAEPTSRPRALVHGGPDDTAGVQEHDEVGHHHEDHQREGRRSDVLHGGHAVLSAAVVAVGHRQTPSCPRIQLTMSSPSVWRTAQIATSAAMPSAAFPSSSAVVIPSSDSVAEPTRATNPIHHIFGPTPLLPSCLRIVSTHSH